MTLTIQKQEDEQRQMNLTIEVGEDRVKSQMRFVAKQLAKDYRVPGFRPGKTPYNVIVKRFGEESIRAQAVEEMVNDIVFEAITQEEINFYLPPSLDDLELNPTVLKVSVPLEPSVTLGDYREMRQEIESVEVTDEAVEEALAGIQQQHTTTEEVDRPTEKGDQVRVTGKAVFDDESEDGTEDVLFDEANGMDFVLDKELTFSGTKFVDEMLGLSAGDEKEFKVKFPKKYTDEDAAGRTATFNITVVNVMSREVPPLDDELAKLDGEHETLDELRAATREKLQEEAESAAKSKLLDETIEAMRAEATLTYPPAAITHELDHMVEDFKRQISQYGWNWEDYLAMQNETEESLHDQWRDQAVKNFENGLTMREFIAAEKLSVTDEEIGASVDERLERFNDLDEDTLKMMRDLFASGESRQQMANAIMIDKVHDRMQAILTGNAPDLAALEAAAEAEEALADVEEAAPEAEEAAPEDEAEATAVVEEESDATQTESDPAE